MSPSVTSSSSSHHFTKPPRPPTVTANRPRRASSPSNPISRTSVLRQRAVTDTRPARSQLHAQRVQRDSEMSAFSSKEQLASSASDLSLRPSSRDTRSSGISQWTEERADGLARSFLTKSSKLLMKRRGSKVGLSSIRTLEWLEDTEDTTGSKHVQELSKRRKSKHSRDQSAGYETMLKHSISAPYNFQHVTHTAGHQAKALQSATSSELVTEFSAIRASQAPRAELKGIKAETLESMKNSIKTDSPVASPERPSFASLSPPRSRDQWNHETSRFDDSKSIRYSRSIDSFTRVASRSFNSPTPPISPPPRRSSRTVLPTRVPSAFQESPTSPDFVFDLKDGPLSHHHKVFSSTGGTISPEDGDMHFDISTIAQAVTTPDDSAYIVGTHQHTSSSTGLADVPEEDEAWSRTRNSVVPSRPATISSIRHSKSFPAPEAPGTTHSFPLAQDKIGRSPATNGEWVTVSDPTLPLFSEEMEDLPVRPRYSRRMSTGLKGLEESWEDDIDFCYEHAAEADSAFDWDNPTKACPATSGTSVDACTIGNLSDSEALPPLPSSPSSDHIEESDTPQAHMDALSSYFSPQVRTARSTMSSATTVPGIVTPVEPIYSAHYSTAPTTPSGLFIVPQSPSFLVAQDYPSRAPHEDAYHQRLEDGEEPKHKDQLLGRLFTSPGHENYSPSSSDFQLSKCSSRDSSTLSGPSSAGPRSINNGSSCSLPDLARSAGSRERVRLAAEKLAHDIANLNVAENPRELSRAIDLARFNLLRSATSTESIKEEAEAEADDAPIVLPSVWPRNRSTSDSADQVLKLPSSRCSLRTRSSSVATTLSGKSKSSRASYSLFPTMVAR